MFRRDQLATGFGRAHIGARWAAVPVVHVLGECVLRMRLGVLCVHVYMYI